MNTKNKIITYSLEYNNESGTWVIFKTIESNHSINFYAIAESENKDDLKELYEKLKKEEK